MPYKSFNSTRNKFRKLNENISNNSQSILHQQTSNSIITSNISRLSLDFNSFVKIRKFNSEWENADIMMAGNIIAFLYKIWQIEFLALDIKYLSFFKSEILVKYSATDTFNIPYSTYFSKNFIWDIKDLEDNPKSNIKHIILNASIYIAKASSITIPPYQTKLLVNFVPQQLD